MGISSSNWPIVGTEMQPELIWSSLPAGFFLLASKIPPGRKCLQDRSVPDSAPPSRKAADLCPFDSARPGCGARLRFGDSVNCDLGDQPGIPHSVWDHAERHLNRCPTGREPTRKRNRREFGHEQWRRYGGKTAT